MKEKEINKVLGKIFYIEKVKLRVEREVTDDKVISITWPSHVAELKLIKGELLTSDREIFLALHLNTKHRLLSYEVVSVGCLYSSVVHPREIFKGAILSNAHSLILCHNHPSGEVEPSVSDLKLTQRLKMAGDIIGIEVLDHMIFGSEKKFLSMKEKELL